MCKATAYHTYFSMNPAKSFAYLADDHTPIVQSPTELDQEIQQMRDLGDQRPAVVVVSGTPDFMMAYLRGVQKANFFVFVGPLKDLEELPGIEILDRNWNDGDPPIRLDHHLEL